MRIIIWLHIVLLFPFLLAGGDIHAQIITFEKTFGDNHVNDDMGYSVRQTTDGGYIIAGYTNGFGAGNFDVYLIKTDSSGDTLWTKTFGGSGDDESYSVQQTTDGGYIVAGYTNSFGAGGYNVYLIKTDTDGNTVWTKTYGGSGDDGSYCVQQTTDGGFIITGDKYSSASSGDVYLIKTDTNGNAVWTKTYGGSDYDGGRSVQQTTDGGYIVAGYTNSFGGGDNDVYLVKTDANGNTLWTKTYGSFDGGNDWALSVQQTTDGGYVLTGVGLGILVHLVKFNSSGNMIWSKRFAVWAFLNGYSVQQTTDGGYIVACGLSPLSGSAPGGAFLVKTDANGDTLWTKIYEDDVGRDAEALSVRQTTDGGYIVSGYTFNNNSSGWRDIFLLKADANGNTKWRKFFGNPNRTLCKTLLIS